MFDRVLRRNAAGEERGAPDTGRSALILAMIILGIMGVAIAIDAFSVPGLAVLTVVVIAGLIAALAAWG
jgi:hypothetical protein